MMSCPICCFAATEEAWRLNRKSPLKFVAAEKCREPYAIRSKEEIESKAELETPLEEAETKVVKKRKRVKVEEDAVKEESIVVEKKLKRKGESSKAEEQVVDVNRRVTQSQSKRSVR